MTAPYYRDAHVTIYHGDARAVLPGLSGESLITDPVWPNAHPDLRGADDPYGLLQETLAACPSSFARLVIWLGCQSDPRFLSAVPPRWPFLRMQYLRRAVPSYNGRALVTGDVVYAFGEWPTSAPGRRVIPGEVWRSVTNPRARQPHPAARNLGHALWVLRWWGSGLVVDPFAGAGTILVAAKFHNLHAVGIEVEERHCETAALRCSQGQIPL